MRQIKELPLVIDSGLKINTEYRNEFKIELEKYKKISPNFLLNPLFLHFNLLIEKIHDGDCTFIPDFVIKFHHPRGRKLKRRFSVQEIRKIRSLIFLIRIRSKSANKKRIKFLGLLRRKYGII